MRDKLKEFKRMDTVQSGENVYSTVYLKNKIKV